MLKIGNWDGGVGEKILLPASMYAPDERRALALSVVAYLRDAGFDVDFEEQILSLLAEDLKRQPDS
jgi:hypothetical protein